MTIQYTSLQVNESDKIKDIREKNFLWRPVPGTSQFQAHVDGTIWSTTGPAPIIQDSRFGLYTPLAGSYAPVHLLVAATWLPYPGHLSAFELTAYFHRLVVHRDGVNYHNEVENLAWADCPGDGDPDLYAWLMRQRPVPKARDVVRGPKDMPNSEK